jgi:hypothetical protein
MERGATVWLAQQWEAGTGATLLASQTVPPSSQTVAPEASNLGLMLLGQSALLDLRQLAQQSLGHKVHEIVFVLVREFQLLHFIA